MSAAVQQMFNRIAPTYDTVNRVLSLGIDQSWRRRAIATLRLPEAAPAGSAQQHGAPSIDAAPESLPLAIDLCAGTLDLTLLLCPRARVQAVDFSAEMLQRGRDKIPEALRPRVTLVNADAAALPLVDGQAAGLVCGFGIRNVDRDKIPQALREARRVLKPGGRMAILEFFRPQRALTRAAHWFYNRQVLPLVGGAVSGDRDAYRYLVRSIEGFHSTADFAALVQEAGFVDVEVEDLTLGIASLVTATVPAEGSVIAGGGA